MIEFLVVVTIAVASFIFGTLIERNRPSRNYCVRCIRKLP